MLLSVKAFIFILLRFHDTNGSIFHSKGSRMKLHIAQISAISVLCDSRPPYKDEVILNISENVSFWEFYMISFTMYWILLFGKPENNEKQLKDKMAMFNINYPVNKVVGQNRDTLHCLHNIKIDKQSKKSYESILNLV